MNESLQRDNTLILGQRLPPKIAEVVSATGSGTAINLPYGLIVVALTDYKPEDLTNFNGFARFRVGLAQNFLLISPKFRGLNCDIVWSPLIARMVGEPEMDRPSASDAMMFNFVLVAGNHIVRSIRLATISPDVTMALWRARSELLARAITAASIQSEMTEIFDQYRAAFPRRSFMRAVTSAPPRHHRSIRSPWPKGFCLSCLAGVPRRETE